MLKPEDVSALYKRAVIRLHPDKNTDKDYQTKYLSKRIFELLNEAKKAQKWLNFSVWVLNDCKIVMSVDFE